MDHNGDTNTRHDGEEPQAPPRLVAALKELPPRRVFVPPTLDERVIRAARQHLAAPQRTGWVGLRPWLSWLALAASCFVIAMLVLLTIRKTPTRQASADLNHDGQVDILDAFQLERDLQARKKAVGPDVNGDGVVDGKDVTALAAKAVALPKGGRS